MRIDDIIANGVVILLGVVLPGLILLRFIRTALAKTVSLPAVVVDRYDLPTERSRYATYHTRYVARFDTGQRVLSFFVSPLVYGSLSKGQQGTLTYKANRFLDFE